MKKYLLVILTIMLFFVSGCQKKDENITTKGTATIGEVKVIQDKAVVNDLILTLQEDFIPMMEMTGLLISINQKDIKTNKDSYFEKNYCQAVKYSHYDAVQNQEEYIDALKEQVAQLGSYQIENELQESQRQYAYEFFMRGIHTIDFIQNHDMDNCHRFMDQFISEIVKPGLNDTINKEDMNNPKYDLKDFGVMPSEYIGYNR